MRAMDFPQSLARRVIKPARFDICLLDNARPVRQRDTYWSPGFLSLTTPDKNCVSYEWRVVDG
jgi:hypothetical protein